MIVSQQFFEPLRLGNLFGSTALELELEAELPNFMTYEHTQQQHLAADQKYQYDLTKLVNLTKQDALRLLDQESDTYTLKKSFRGINECLEGIRPSLEYIIALILLISIKKTTVPPVVRGIIM